MLKLVLLINTIWFGLAFHLFYFRRRIFAKSLVSAELRDTPVFETLTEVGKFLGGLNLAFAILNIFLLFNLLGFDKNIQWAFLLVVNAVAHGSQFAGNVPIALDNRRGAGVWVVFKGRMRVIFVVDFALMMLNIVFAAIYFF